MCVSLCFAGFGAGFLDVFFGTFQAKFKEEGGATARDDAKSTIRGMHITVSYSVLTMPSRCSDFFSTQ